MRGPGPFVRGVAALSAFVLACACGDDSLFLRLPARSASSQTLVAAVERSGSIQVTSFDLGLGDVVIDVRDDALAYVTLLLYDEDLRTLELPAGDVPGARVDDCVPAPLPVGASAMYGADVAGGQLDFGGLDSLRPAVADFRRLAPCPCRTFDVTPIPLQSAAAVYELFDLSDGGAWMLLDGAVAQLSVDGGLTVYPAPEFFLSGHPTFDGGLWLGSGLGGLWRFDPSSGFRIVAPPESGNVVDMDGARSTTTELFTNSSTGELRTFDGTSWTLLHRIPGGSDGTSFHHVVWLAPGRAIAARHGAFDLVRIDTTRTPPERSEPVRDGFGSVRSLDRVPEIGSVAASRNGLVAIVPDQGAATELPVRGIESSLRLVNLTLPTPGGFVLMQEQGAVVQYYESFGFCASFVTDAYLNLDAGIPWKGGFLVGGFLEEGSGSELNRLLHLVPRESP